MIDVIMRVNMNLLVPIFYQQGFFMYGHKIGKMGEQRR